MKPENLNIEEQISESESDKPESNLRKVTPLSKYLAMMLFIILPFLGGWIGYSYALEKEVIEEEVIIPDTKTINDEPVSESPLVSEGEYKKIIDLTAMNPLTQVYYSENLGIAFTYFAEYQGVNLAATTEIGGRVYVYKPNIKSTADDSADFIEVFKKESSQSLEEAVREDFLQAYEFSCDLVEVSKKYSGIDGSLGFERLIDGPQSGMPDRQSNPCPDLGGYGYYFVGLAGDLERYVLIGHGQEVVFSDGNELGESGFYSPWYTSIRSLR